MTASGTLTLRPSDRHWILRIGMRDIKIPSPTETDGETPWETLRSLADSVRPVVAAWGFCDCSIDVIEIPASAPYLSVVVGNITIKDGGAVIALSSPPAVTTAEPWVGPRCDLLKPLKLLLLASNQIPCHECNYSRAKCGGLPRADGDPRP